MIEENIKQTAVDSTATKLILNISMLGCFSVRLGEEVLSDSYKKSRRLWLLLKLLILKWGKRVTTQELIDTLWRGEECVFPERALQNLVYRLRILLGDEDYIIQSHGTYRFNTSMRCTVDTERFEHMVRLARAADNRRDIAARELYGAAISYYSGELLPVDGNDNWLTEMRKHYSELFVNSVLRLCELTAQVQRHELIIQICTDALIKQPDDVRIAAKKIEALIDIGRLKKAKDEYDKILGKLEKSKITPTPELAKSKRRLEVMEVDEISDINGVIACLDEKIEAKGAFMCTRDAFCAISRVERRKLSRNGGTIILLILSIVPTNNKPLGKDRIDMAISELTDYIQGSLRRSDVFTRWNRSQMAILMHSLTYENGIAISERIMSRYVQNNKDGETAVRRNICELQRDGVGVADMMP
ncbi:MAG: BTAD domain-containing putative transcriptional regulator [Oscillospiraceae bacterium]